MPYSHSPNAMKLTHEFEEKYMNEPRPHSNMRDPKDVLCKYGVIEKLERIDIVTNH